MKTPEPNDLRLAAQWLSYYEDADDEGDKALLENVAQWLEHKAELIELKAVASELGVTVPAVRELIRQRNRPPR